jgi:hypothetical protein
MAATRQVPTWLQSSSLDQAITAFHGKLKQLLERQREKGNSSSGSLLNGLELPHSKTYSYSALPT